MIFVTSILCLQREVGWQPIYSLLVRLNTSIASFSFDKTVLNPEWYIISTSGIMHIIHLEVNSGGFLLQDDKLS